jgi:hypothetical protein
MYDYAFEYVLCDDSSSQLDQVAEHRLVEANDGLRTGLRQIDAILNAGIDPFEGLGQSDNVGK